MSSFSILYFVALVCVVYSNSLPSYIKPCSRSDPKLNECVKDHANEALPFIVKGDKSIKLPSLSPYRLPEINISPSNNLNMTFKNCIMSYWESIKIINASLNIDKGLLKFNGELEKSNLLADYIMNGRILVLPIQGNGKANITLENIKFDYTLTFKLEKGDDGKEYMKTINSKLLLDPEVTHYDLTNLFNGDKVLGEQMNKFLNENHKEISMDMNPAFIAIVDTVITYILNSVIGKVPFDEVVLP